MFGLFGIALMLLFCGKNKAQVAYRKLFLTFYLLRGVPFGKNLELFKFPDGYTMICPMASYKLPDGNTMVLPSSYHLFEVYFGEYDAVGQLVPKYDIIDVGSFIGAYSLRAAKMIGKGYRVVAIEPHPYSIA